MKQFYETYHKNEKLSLLVREIGWTNNMLIVSQTKTEEEKEFYIKITAREIYPNINEHIRDYYLFEFLGLKDNYSEYNFKKAILTN